MSDNFVSLAAAARITLSTPYRVLTEVARGRVRTLARPGESLRVSSLDCIEVLLDPYAAAGTRKAVDYEGPENAVPASA